MRDLYEHPCMSIRLDPATGVIRVVRSEVPYGSLADLMSVHSQIGRILDQVGREKHTLLVDMRRAVMNNDPAFEKAAERARHILVRGFGRVAVVVQTAVGALQVKRHVREDGRDIGVFSAEAQALAFLAGKAEAPEEPPVSGVAPTSDGPFRDLVRRSGQR